MLEKLNINDRIFAAAGLVLLVASFLPWHSFDVPFLGEITRNGWESPSTPWSTLAVILGVGAAVVLVLDRVTEVKIPEKIGSLPISQWYAIEAAIVAVLLVIKLLDENEFLAYGFWLAAIAAAAMVYAALANIGKVRTIGSAGDAGGAPPPAE